MGTESYTYMGRSFSGLSINDDSTSSAFSDCNSDRSGEFATTSSQSRRLLIACASENSDELIRQLVSDLHSSSIDDQKQAAMELRLLAKNKPENRIRIAKAGAIKPLISLICSQDLQLQEYGVTAILNLSLCDENKELIAASGAIKPLVRALNSGTSTAKENAACALLRLSQVEENKAAIGRSGAVSLLVNLLGTGGIRAKKDASTALYSLCTVRENKIRAVKAGIMKVLIELMADFESNMVDKSAYVVSVLVSMPEAKVALVEEGGVPVLVEIVEVGSQRQKEIAVVILLQICEDSVTYRTMVAREGAIPPLVALTQSGTNRAKQKLQMQPKRKLDVLEVEVPPEDKINNKSENQKKKPRVDGQGCMKNVRSKKNQKVGTIKGEEAEETNNITGSNGHSSSSNISGDDDINASQENSRGATSESKSALNSNGKARASRGSATDPQSLYARKRRERINERLRILQNLVPNGTKVDISTMLEEAVNYVKFLQLQIKLLSSDDLWMYAPLAYTGLDIGLNLNIQSSPLL